MSAPWTWHGGGIEAAQRRFGGDDWIDLSTGINPHPWPGATTMVFDWQRLPEPDAVVRLEGAAAAYFGVDARLVCAVPGTEIGLRLVGAQIGGAAQHVVPGYRTHGAMMARSAAVAWSEVGDSAGHLILANPNNPDGRTVPAAAMHDLLARRDGWLLVDEAFADTDPVSSVAASIENDRQLIVFRSFGKFFGLAGVRLGFVLAPEAVVAALRARLGAWPLSAAAIAIGTAAYADGDWIAATRRRLGTKAAALDAILTEKGLDPAGACSLFRLIEVDDAHALFAHLARRAILTRPFDGQRHWLRFGLPADDKAMARLAAALDAMHTNG